MAGDRGKASSRERRWRSASGPDEPGRFDPRHRQAAGPAGQSAEADDAVQLRRLWGVRGGRLQRRQVALALLLATGCGSGHLDPLPVIPPAARHAAERAPIDAGLSATNVEQVPDAATLDSAVPLPIATLKVEYAQGCPTYECGAGYPVEDVAQPVITASSESRGLPVAHAMGDSRKGRGWCSQRAGEQWLHLDFAEDIDLAVIVFTPGLATDKKSYFDHGRVHGVRVETATWRGRAEIEADVREDSLAGNQNDVLWPVIDLKANLGQPVRTRWLRLVLEDSYAGDAIDDVCVTNLAVMRWRTAGKR
jgi:hypothetical protein